MSKNPHWLQVEVCREYMRGNCSRTEDECRFAHPPEHVSAENGKVTACFDSMKDRCQREKCKYLHPPKHIKMQLEINGKNFQSQKTATQQMLNSALTFPAAQWVNALAPFTLISDPSTFNSIAQDNSTQYMKADKMEVCRQYRRGNCSRGEEDCKYAHAAEGVSIDSNGFVTVCMDFMKGRCQRDTCKYFHPLPHLQAQVRALQQQQIIHQNTNNLMLEGSRKRSREEKDDMGLTDNMYTKKMAVDPTQNLMASPFIFPGTAFTQPAFQQALAAMQFIPTLPLMQDLNATGFPVLQSQQPAPLQQSHSMPENDLQVCRDYEKGKCNRPTCKYAHVDNRNVSTMEGRVTICRDFIKGKCTRAQCKYYHMPVLTVPIVS